MIPYKVYSENMTNEQIAKIAHETNRQYCQALGDDSQLSWEEAPQWQRDSAIQGVAFVMEHLDDLQAKDQHDSWCRQKIADGWTYGEVKDPEKKTHPCLVPFEQLPEEQQRKDCLFGAIVLSLAYPIKKIS